jgi:putative ABC transport system permease protein
MLAALLRQRRRLALATIAIALGVGYLAGALTLLDRVGEGLSNLASTGVGAEDLVVEGEVAYESSLEQVRRLVPSSVADTVRAVPGVRAVTPRIEDVAVVLGSDGRPVVAPGLSEQPLGANWPAGAPVPPYDLLTGVAPTGSSDVVLDERTAQVGGLRVGDEVSVAGRTRVGSYRVTGIVAQGQGGLPPGASLALFSTAEARELFDRPFDDNWVGVTVDDGADPAAVQQAISAQLPSGAVVVDAATAAADRQDGLTRSFALVRSLLIGFAALALLVGMVTVANSLALLYAERRRTFASFRLVGAKPGQLLFAALIEATLLALVASLLGAPLGLLVGRGIETILAALGSPIPVAGSFVSWQALGWAVLIGVVATVAAAVVPALRVCRVPPIEAVDDATTGPRPDTSATVRTAAIAALLAGGAVTVLLLQGRSTSVALTAGAVAAAVVFLIGLTPMALAAIVAGGVRLLPVPPAALRRIASRDVRRSRTRTAATTGALAIATAVIVGLAVCLTSFVASLEAEVERTVQADLVVDSGTFTRGGLPAELLVDLKETPGVDAASGWQLARGTLGSTPIRATGLDADAALEVVGFDFVAPAPTRLGSDSILLSEQVATAAGVTVGESVPVVFTSGGTEFLEVAGIFRGGGALIGDGVVDRSVVLRQVPATPDLAALVALDPDDPAAADAVVALAAEYGIEGVLQPEEFVDQRSDLLRGFQRVIQWMLLFTLLQALVGVVNTLLLSVGERRREFGLLRATGATRPQVHRMILLEGVALALVGALVGLVLGLVLSRLALLPLAPLGLDTFVVPVPAVAAVALLAVVVGVLAAVLPARWASRVPPLVAVSDTGDLELRRRRRRVAPVPTPAVPVPAPAPVTVPTAAVPPPIPIPVPVSVPVSVAGPVERIVAGPGLAPVDLYVPPGVDPSTLTPVVTIGTGSHAGDGSAFRRPLYARSVTDTVVDVPVAPVPMPPPFRVDPVVEQPFEPPVEPLVPPPFVAPLVPPPFVAPVAPPVVTRRPLFGRPPVDPPVEASPELPSVAVVVPIEVPTPPPFVPVQAEPAAVQAEPTLPAPVPEPESPAPRRRRRVFDRRAAGTTRRRQERTARPAADPAVGFLRSDEPTDEFVGGASVDGPVAPAGAAPAFGGTPTTPVTGGGSGSFGSPGSVPPPPPVPPSFELPSFEPPSFEPPSSPERSVLALLADALAAGEQVRQIVLGRAGGFECALARSDRRLLVVADRPGRPFVQSLHPHRTVVHVLGPRALPATVVVVDGDRRLEVVGVTDRDEADRLAAG